MIAPTINCKTDAERIVAYLWSIRPNWAATHELMGRDTPFGFIGSAGHVRARELARNECADKLKDKVQRRRGGEIGLDPQFEYFRYRLRRSDRAVAAEMCRLFDAGAPAEQIFEVF